MIERYRPAYVRLRAYAHAMLTGLIVAFCVGFSAWGFVALLFPILLEVTQWVKDGTWDAKDGL